LALDHNYDLTPEATKLVESPVSAPYLDGVAFHCYGGDPSDTDVLWRAHPEVPFYSTECTGLVNGHRFKTDIGGWLNALVLRPTMSSFLAWNLALFTPGRRPSGFQNCPECLGYVTVDPEAHDFRIEPELFATQHASQFIRPGARPLATVASAALDLRFLAAINRDGGHVLVVNNRRSMPQKFRLRNEQGGIFDFEILPMSVVTMTWR
jgi:glucosylceramidase